MANVEYSNIVKAPIVLTSVAQLLGTNIKDLGRLCTSDKINQWARYKPVSFKSVVPITEDNLVSVMYGLVPNENTEAEKCIVSGNASKNISTDAAWKEVVDANRTWGYTKPSGGENSPYRLTDFANPSSPTGNFGYVHNTPPPITNLNTWRIMKSTLVSLYSGNQATTVSGSDGKSNPNNYVLSKYTNSVVYSSFTMRFGDATQYNLNGASTYCIPFNKLLGLDGDQYYRMCIAVRVPNQNYAELVCSRMSFWEANKQSISGQDVVQAITPYLATNQYLCYLLAQAIGSNMTLEVDALPLVGSNIWFDAITSPIAPSKQLARAVLRRSSTTYNNSRIFSLPSNSVSIKIEIVNDVDYTAAQRLAYTYFSIETRATQQYASFGGGESWNRVYINELIIRVLQQPNTQLTLTYNVTYVYVTGVNSSGSKTTSTQTISGSRTFTSQTAVDSVVVLAANPGLSINSKTMSATSNN